MMRKTKRNAPIAGASTQQHHPLGGLATSYAKSRKMSISIANADSNDNSTPPQRVAVYVDGLNLYYGLKSRGWRRYYRLDLRRLAELLLRPSQQLAMVRYFTARFEPQAGDPGQHTRQDTYLQALETLPNLTIQYGHHQPTTGVCRRCGTTWRTFEEKMTDVNIAVALLRDAVQDAFDTAIVISADSDLTGPLDAVLQTCPGKRVVVAFPPNRNSERLRRQATAAFTLGRKIISDSQLPPQIIKPDGYAIDKPSRWN